MSHRIAFLVNENGLKWIEIQIFQKYFTNVKMNAFQSWMHFYSFIKIAWSISLSAFQSKNNISFLCTTYTLWILFNSKFWIGNAVFQSNCIQLNLIESNWIQLNPKRKYSLFNTHSYRKKFQSILIYSRLLSSKT